jgi:hypothetical protein
MALSSDEPPNIHPGANNQRRRAGNAEARIQFFPD